MANFQKVKIEDKEAIQIEGKVKEPLNFKQLMEEEKWSDLKKIRSYFTVNSIKKAVIRCEKQRKQEMEDIIAQEELMNEKIKNAVNYEKVAAEYGDTSSITKGSFSKDGSFYCTVGSSGEGKIWNVKSPNSQSFCQVVTSLKSLSKICDVDFHPRVGKIPQFAPNLITGSTNGELLIWTLALDNEDQKSILIQAHEDRINYSKFDSTGNYFFTASYDKSWSLWDTKKMQTVFTQKGHEKEIHTASLHPDESLFFTADLGGSGMVWDIRTGKGIYEVSQQNSILCSAFNPNGFQLAVAGKTNIISIFDLRRKKQWKKIPAHLKLISDIKYSSNELFLVSVSHDNDIKLWHGKNYTPIIVQDMKQPSKLTSVDLSEGKMAATGIDRKFSMFVEKQYLKSTSLVEEIKTEIT